MSGIYSNVKGAGSGGGSITDTLHIVDTLVYTGDGVAPYEQAPFTIDVNADTTRIEIKAVNNLDSNFYEDNFVFDVKTNTYSHIWRGISATTFAVDTNTEGFSLENGQLKMWMFNNADRVMNRQGVVYLVTQYCFD